MKKLLKVMVSLTIGLSALFVFMTQINALENATPQPRVNYWEEGRSARVANYNRYVQLNSSANVYSNGNVELTSTWRDSYVSLVIGPWVVQRFGSAPCWGVAFNAYDSFDQCDLIGAILGNCYGSNCTCPFSPNPNAYRNCSC